MDSAHPFPPRDHGGAGSYGGPRPQCAVDERRHSLLRLRHEVRQLIAQIACLRADTLALLDTEQQRRLTADEQARARQATLQSAHLWARLQQLRSEMANLQRRSQHTDGSQEPREPGSAA